MTTKVRRPLAEVLPIAEALAAELRTFCKRVEVAGSVRRRAAEVGDVEIVAIPRFEIKRESQGQLPFFTSELRDRKVNLLWDYLETRGTKFSKAGEKYRQFEREGIQVDVFTATPETWGWQFVIRTGPAEFSHSMAAALNRTGHTSRGGHLHKISGPAVPAPEEADVFSLAKLPFVDPERRA